MLIDIFGWLYGPDVIAAFSGAMLFIINQNTFKGVSRIIAFIVSFIMGNIGSATTATLIQQYLPEGIQVGKEVGAFICSALIVTVSMLVIRIVEIRINAVSPS